MCKHPRYMIRQLSITPRSWKQKLLNIYPVEWNWTCTNCGTKMEPVFREVVPA